MGRNSNDNERQRAHTRALLVQTALELFAEHGVTGTTMASLARAAGVSKGLTYHYFPSKDALVAAVVAQRRDALRALGDAIPVDLPPAQKLRAFARASVEQVANDPGGFRLYLRFLAAPDGQASVGAAGLDRSELIGLFVAMGSLEPAADARFFTTTLLGILTHLAISPVPTPVEPLLQRLFATLHEAP